MLSAPKPNRFQYRNQLAALQMRKPSLKYVGNKAVQALLSKYDCPVPFHAVRTRFVGNIATTRLDASPVEAIKNLWGGELPEVENFEAINELFDTFTSLWNEMARHQSRKKPFKLSHMTVVATDESLHQYCQTRVDEIDGFVGGLFADQDMIDLPERADEGMMHLGEIRAMLLGVIDLLKRQPLPSSEDELSKTVKNMRDLSRIAQTEINEVVLSCKRARGRMLSQGQPSDPTVH